jgi:hypothetical protein
VPHRGAINFMFAAATTLGFQHPVSNFVESPLSLTGCTNGAITFDLSIAGLYSFKISFPSPFLFQFFPLLWTPYPISDHFEPPAVPGCTHGVVTFGV